MLDSAASCVVADPFMTMLAATLAHAVLAAALLPGAGAQEDPPPLHQVAQLLGFYAGDPPELGPLRMFRAGRQAVSPKPVRRSGAPKLAPDSRVPVVPTVAEGLAIAAQELRESDLLVLAEVQFDSVPDDGEGGLALDLTQARLDAQLRSGRADQNRSGGDEPLAAAIGVAFRAGRFWLLRAQYRTDMSETRLPAAGSARRSEMTLALQHRF